MKKFFIGLVAFTFLFSLYAPGISQAASFEPLSKEVKINNEKEISNSGELEDLVKIDDEMEATAAKGQIIKGALYTIKGAIKGGDWILGLIEDKMGAKSIKYLRDNTTKVNQGIDKAIAKLDELTVYTQATIRGILYEGLIAVKVPPAAALDIAENVSAVVSFLVL
ncbi:hypothetical protein [Sporosarcina sp. FSL K6-3457]|uniref:hypothetical protein n=1 Tax=Sporosarcina sp. FSL K6-3457 TaxID=2978204 RepID=UPI0030F5DB3B